MRNVAKVAAIVIAMFSSNKGHADDSSKAENLLIGIGETKGPIAKQIIKDSIPVVFTDIANDNSIDAKIKLAFGNDPDAVKKLLEDESRRLSNNKHVADTYKDSFLGEAVSAAKKFTENVADSVNSWKQFMSSGGEITMPTQEKVPQNQDKNVNIENTSDQEFTSQGDANINQSDSYNAENTFSSQPDPNFAQPKPRNGVKRNNNRSRSRCNSRAPDYTTAFPVPGRC